MKVLVTGGCGFIGSHVVDKLLDSGHEPIVIHRPTCNSRNLKDKKDVKLYDCDVRDISKIGHIIKDVDSIVHMAALINVDESIESPLQYYDINVKGMLSLLELVRKHKKRLIYFSTCEVYGHIPEGKANEGHQTNPRSPYAASKLAAEKLGMVYYYTHKVPITVIRNFNCFGPRQSATKYGAVIPKFIKTVLNDEPPTIFGDGLQTRDYVYVTDTAEGIKNVVERRDLDGEIINFATGVDYSVRDIAKKIIKISGKDMEPKFIDARAGELKRSVGDSSKALKLLGWKPKVDFDEGLKRTIEWFRTQDQV